MALAGGLALAATLLLAPGAARAVNDCGALNAANMFTENCPYAAYASAIVYWDQTNAVTLTVPGTAATTTITAAANNGLHNGITIRTNDDTTSPRTSPIRNIALTVGSAAGAVAIVQSGTRASSWYNNRGILVVQRDGGGATTTVDVKSGVTIGTETDKMENGGIEVVASQSDAGAVTVTSAAAIYSEADGDRPGGIHIGNAGSGAVMLTNSGAIVSDARGINVEDTGSAGAVTIVSSGAVTSAATTALEGIRAVSTGKDAANTVAGVTITHSAGAVSVAMGGVGIKAHVGASRSEGDTEGAGYQAPMNAGLAKVAVTGGSVTSKGNAVEAANYETGSVEVMVAAGVTATSTEGRGIDAVLHDVGNTAGTVSVTSAGDVTAATQSAIRARNSAGNRGAVTVMVTGGEAKSEGQSRPAVEVLQEGAGDAVAGVSSGATLTSKHNAGIYANLRHVGNDEGQVKITQAGIIAARKGVYARVGRAVTIAAGETAETRAAADQPVIDVTWTGSFSHGTSVTVAQNDDDRFLARDVAHAVAIAQEVETEKVIRYGSAAGIEAQVMSWRDVMTAVAKGDDPGMVADTTAAGTLLSGTDGPTIRTAFRAVLENADLDDIPNAGNIDADSDGTTSDTEIDTYLTANLGVLRNVLAQGFTDAEKAVLRAVATNEGLDAALDNEDAGFSDDYKEMVKALLDRYNPGDIRIAVGTTAASTTGSIVATRGDGIRAYYATQNDANGAIEVTVAAGTTVSGGMAGIYVANAGMGTDDVPKQTVTVHGTVMGGTDSAVHLSGGGRLTVGEMGRVLAGSSGVGVLVNDPGPAHVTIDGLVRGAEGGAAAVHLTGGGSVTVGPMGRVEANEAARVILADNEPVSVIVRTRDDGLTQKNVREAAGRIDGRIEGRNGGNITSPGSDGTSREGVTFTVAETVNDGVIGDRVPTGGIITLPLDEGRPNLDNRAFKDLPSGEAPPSSEDEEEDKEEEPPPPAPDQLDCERAAEGDAQCRLYEALPSVLLAMNDLPTYAERMSAARDGKGGWAQVEAAGGKWKADSSTRPNVAYDHRRYGVRAGMDFTAGEAGRVGVSVHGLRGSAEMASPRGGNNEVELSGGGLGVNATAAMAGGVHVDAQAAVTWYDVDLKAATLGSLKKDARGMGYALGVEVGRRMPVAEDVFLTPHGGLLWSKVDMDDFTQQVEGSTVRPRISMKDADSLVGRVGVMVDTAVGSEDAPGRVFGSVDVEHEFKDETSVDVAGVPLKTTARSSGVRFGLGGEFTMREGVVLRLRADYTRMGGDTNEYGGGVELNLRF